MSLLRPGGLELTRAALKRCNLPKGAALLDVGCGDGTAAAMAAEEFGLTVTGVDLNRAAVDAAKAKGVNALVQSADALEFPSRSFDAVLMECVFSVLPRQEEAIHEAYCMLRPGGVLILSDLYVRQPDMERYRRDYKAAMAQFRRPRQHDDCGHDAVLPSPYCQDGAVVLDGLTGLLEELGLAVTLVEDHTADLKAFLGQVILDCGSLDAYVQAMGGDRVCRCTAKSAGYFLMLARKKHDA
ncbi:MAG: class I SAM-dependent methyltransferase [Oscillospiraceae bacterium]|nr:class I SAM-dependent methyltransferase [Oscillospiraceae bacterium]